MKVAERTVVVMDYELSYPDGEMIESSIALNQPMQFVYGRGQVLAAIEKAILEKEAGDELSVSLTPEEAYGSWEESGVCGIPRSQFPVDLELEEGMTFMMESEDGRPQPFTVVKVEGDEVSVDFNHPLAGESLVFKLMIRDVRDATLEELTAASSGCGCGSANAGGCDSGCC